MLSPKVIVPQVPLNSYTIDTILLIVYHGRIGKRNSKRNEHLRRKCFKIERNI